MRFRVTYKLPIPISVIIDHAKDQRDAMEQANLIEEVRFAIACFMVGESWKEQADGSGPIGPTGGSGLDYISIDVEPIPSDELEPESGRIG